MKDLLFIGGLCTLIVVVGAFLYFYSPESGGFHDSGSVPYTVLTNGQNAVNVDTEINYRISSAEEFDALWSLIHGTDRPSMPAVDFEQNDVLAVFDGSHSTGGYSIRVTEVIDAELTRTVHITHIRPGDDCMTASGQTSPYELVVVPKMREGLRLAHSDLIDRADCR